MRSNSRLPPMAAIIAAAALAWLTSAAPAFADKVGTAGAVNLKSLSTPPGGGLRVVEIGAQVVQNEKIETSATGSVQLLFIDKTTLNIGPNSRLVIDKFVFNPMTTQGEVALTLSAGVLRIVGGLATHTGGAAITTPVATVGIRGGIATVLQSKEKGTQAILGFGVLTMTSGCGAPSAAQGVCTPQTVTVTRPGFMVQSASAGSPPSAPVRATAAQIDQANALLTSKSGQTGGASAVPTDRLAAGYNVGTPNSPAATVATNPPPPGRGSNLAAIATATQQLAQQAVQITTSVTTSNTVTTTTSQLPAPPAAYAILTNAPYSTSLGASPVPYLTASYAGTGNFTVSPILGYQAGGLNPNGTTDVTSRQLQAGLRVTGQGASQTSTLFVMTSIIKNAPDIGFTQGGGISGVDYQPQVDNVGDHSNGAVASAIATSSPNSVPTNSFGKPIGGYTLYDENSNLSAGTLSSNQSVEAIDGAYTFNPIATATPTSLTINHPNLILKGYAGGLMQSAYINPINSTNNGQYSAPYIVTNATGKPGDVTIYLPGNSSRMGAVFNVASVNPPASGYNSASYQFGSYSPTDPNNAAGRNDARGAYVDPTDFAGRATTIFDNGANVPTSSRNGIVLSGTADFADNLMVTANTVGANTAAFLTSISSTTVTPCACEFTQWGFWSSLTGQSLDNGVSRYADSGSVPMLWVAGVPAVAGNIPTTGTATYTGHAVADIANNGAQYVAAGTFSNTVNFGTRVGAVAIGGLDGTNYAGNVGLTPSSTLFAGNLTGSLGNRVAALNGAFFQGGATNSTPLYGEMGGSLTLSGANYLGSGIFLGRKP